MRCNLEKVDYRINALRGSSAILPEAKLIIWEVVQCQTFLIEGLGSSPVSADSGSDTRSGDGELLPRRRDGGKRIALGQGSRNADGARPWFPGLPWKRGIGT